MKTSFFAGLARRWWFWTGVLVACGIGGLVWSGYRFGQPTRTHFMLSVETRSLTFTVGDWPGSVGLFAQESMPVDLTINSLCKLRSVAGPTQGNQKAPPPYLGETFREAVLISMDVSPGVRVKTDVVGGSLVFNLERPLDRGPLAPLRFELRRGSPDVRPTLRAGETLELTPADDPSRLEFSIRFRAKPGMEMNLPLASRSRVSFTREGATQLLPGSAVLLLRERGRTRRKDFAVSLDDLQSGVLEKLSLEEKGEVSARAMRTAGRYRSDPDSAPLVAADFLSVQIAGITDKICVQDVPDAAVTNVTKQVMPTFVTSTRVEAIGTVLSALATLFIFIFKERRRQRWIR